MKLQIPTNNILLTYYQSINWLTNLSETEMKVVAFFVTRYNKYKELYKMDDSVVMPIIFGTPERKLLMKELPITSGSLNTTLNHLRTKKVLSKDSEGKPKIAPIFLFNPDKENSMTFIFNVPVPKQESE